MNSVQHQFDRIYSSHAAQSLKGQGRIAWLLSHVPHDTVWVLDVGAGRGRLANAMQERGQCVVALDLSLIGLKQCHAIKVQGSVTQLPFHSNTYDLVVCSEVIEHLTPDLRAAIVQEIDRVSRRYILITVPNNEDLRVMQIKCNHCQTIFHAYGHQMSFTPSSLTTLFPYQPVKLVSSGHRERGWLTPLLVLRHRVFGCYSWDTLLVCPTCNNSELAPPHRNVAVKVLDKLNHLLAREREAGWLLALFDKQA